MKRPRFEVVRTDAGWHARFVAANGRIVWTTEVYTQRHHAERAVTLARESDRSVSPTRWVDERDPNRCDCGHPWYKHAAPFGCSAPAASAAGYCQCGKDVLDVGREGNATNGGAVLVVGSDG